MKSGLSGTCLLTGAHCYDAQAGETVTQVSREIHATDPVSIDHALAAHQHAGAPLHGIGRHAVTSGRPPHQVSPSGEHAPDRNGDERPHRGVRRRDVEGRDRHDARQDRKHTLDEVDPHHTAAEAEPGLFVMGGGAVLAGGRVRRVAHVASPSATSAMRARRVAAS